jgi:hypothetical protein
MLVHLIELVRVVMLPPCAEQWDSWCGPQGTGGLHLAQWSHANKAAHMLQATALLALFGWASFTLLRAAHRRQPLRPAMRYGVIAAFAAWAILLAI